MRERRRGRWTAAILVALLTALLPPRAAADGLAQWRSLPHELAEQVLALSPSHISAADVRDILAHVPAPRIIALDGSFAFVSMARFAEFLVAMGYPEERLRDSRKGDLSQGSFTDSARLAGALAWHYEQDGAMPMLIGHSQGGMLAIRTLHELAGAFANDIAVWNPVLDVPLTRTTITDPLTGATRSVVGLRVEYAAALATGKLARVLLGQWTMLPLLRRIPDTVEDFTGYTIPGDVIAGNLLGDEPYRAIGAAHVRTVTLPASYGHIALPDTRHLADQPPTRAWIDAYAPDAAMAPLPADANLDVSNLLHAADIWHDVKKHWCLAAQRAIRAARRSP
jgi:hypothetical protein